MKNLALTVQKLLVRLKVSKNKKNRPNFYCKVKVKVTSKSVRTHRKGLVTRNTHVKYQSSSTHCLKVINKIKVSDRITNDRMTDGTKKYPL